jgi:hypothetical protein
MDTMWAPVSVGAAVDAQIWEFAADNDFAMARIDG